MHSLQGTLVDETNITPREVVKGGSLGQGTAVDGEFDLDLIIITEGTGSWLGRGVLLALSKPLHDYILLLRHYIETNYARQQ